MPCNSCKLEHLICTGLRIIKCINMSFHLSATVIVLAQMLRKRTASSKIIAKTVDTSETTTHANYINKTTVLI